MDYKKSLSHFRAAAGKSVWETEWKANFKTHRTDRRITRPESHDRDKPKGRADGRPRRRRGTGSYECYLGITQ
jgi:hypothetical protein